MGRGKGQLLVKKAIGLSPLSPEIDKVHKFLDKVEKEVVYRLRLAETIIKDYPQALEEKDKEKWLKILNDFKGVSDPYKRLLAYVVTSCAWVRFTYQVNKYQQAISSSLKDTEGKPLLCTPEDDRRIKKLSSKVQSLDYLPEDLKELVQDDVEKFLKNRKFYVPRSHVIGACVNTIELLSTFPEGTLQKQMADDFKERLQNIKRSADFVSMLQSGMASIAPIVYPQVEELKDLQKRIDKTFEKVNEEIFNNSIEATAFVVPGDWLTYLDDPLHQSVGQVALGFKYIRLNGDLDKINFESNPEKKLYNVLVHEAIHTTQDPTKFDASKPPIPIEVKSAIIEGITEMKTEYLLEKAGKDFWFDNEIDRPGNGIYRGYKAMLATAFEEESEDFDISCAEALLEDSASKTISFLNKNLFNTDSTDFKNVEKLVRYIRSHHKELNDLPANNQAINKWLREAIFKAGCDVKDTLTK